VSLTRVRERPTHPQENKAAAAAMAAAQELAQEQAEEQAAAAATPVPLQGGALRAAVAAERRVAREATKLKQYRFNRALHERLALRVQVRGVCVCVVRGGARRWGGLKSNDVGVWGCVDAPPQELGVTLPAPCSCGHGLSPLDEKYCERCCNNCVFYHDPEALSYALGHLLHAHGVRYDRDA